MSHTSSKDQTQFLNHIHYFRAFAIINIFWAHKWVVGNTYQHQASITFVDIANKVLFHGSTLYFVFISGFLFYYLSNKINVKKYYSKKITNVVLPYIIVSIAITVSGLGDAKSLHDLQKILLYGKAQFHLWYIPVVCGFFLISPLLLLIPRSWLGIIAAASCLLPMIYPRTHIWITINQYLYFLPGYLLGMWVASDYTRAINLMRRYSRYLGLIFVASTGVLVYMALVGDWRKVPEASEKYFFIQKISLCFLILPFFTKLENYRLPVLSRLATYSFSIYFLHNIIVHDWWVMDVYAVLPTANSFMGVSISLAFTAAKLFMVLGVCMALKFMLGRYSRMVIGS